MLSSLIGSKTRHHSRPIALFMRSDREQILSFVCGQACFTFLRTLPVSGPGPGVRRWLRRPVTPATIDPDRTDAGGELLGILNRSMILHGIRIQQYQVSFMPAASNPRSAMPMALAARWVMAASPLQGHGTVVSYVSGKNTREGAIARCPVNPPSEQYWQTPLNEAQCHLCIERPMMDSEPSPPLASVHSMDSLITQKRLRFACLQNSNVSDGQSDIAGFGREIRKNDAISRRDTFQDKANSSMRRDCGSEAARQLSIASTHRDISAVTSIPSSRAASNIAIALSASQTCLPISYGNNAPAYR